MPGLGSGLGRGPRPGAPGGGGGGVTPTPPTQLLAPSDILAVNSADGSGISWSWTNPDLIPANLEWSLSKDGSPLTSGVTTAITIETNTLDGEFPYQLSLVNKAPDGTYLDSAPVSLTVFKLSAPTISLTSDTGSGGLLVGWNDNGTVPIFNRAHLDIPSSITSDSATNPTEFNQGPGDYAGFIQNAGGSAGGVNYIDSDQATFTFNVTSGGGGGGTPTLDPPNSLTLVFNGDGNNFTISGNDPALVPLGYHYVTTLNSGTPIEQNDVGAGFPIATGTPGFSGAGTYQVRIYNRGDGSNLDSAEVTADSTP